jgi:hypothetical protein
MRAVLSSEKYWFSLLQSNAATPALDQLAAARRDGRLP